MKITVAVIQCKIAHDTQMNLKIIFSQDSCTTVTMSHEIGQLVNRIKKCKGWIKHKKKRKLKWKEENTKKDRFL